MEFCPQVATVGFPETTPKEVGRERRKANRVGISFKFIPEMKKIFLLLAFAFCATVAFASNGEPVKDTDVKSLIQYSTTVPQEGQSHEDSQCVYCSKCITVVCVTCNCGDCTEAWNLLWTLMCLQGCCAGGE